MFHGEMIRYDSSATSSPFSSSSSSSSSPQRDLSPHYSSPDSSNNDETTQYMQASAANHIITVDEDEEEEIARSIPNNFMQISADGMEGGDKRKRKRVNKVTFVGETNIPWEDYIPTDNPVLLFQDNQILYVYACFFVIVLLFFIILNILTPRTTIFIAIDSSFPTLYRRHSRDYLFPLYHLSAISDNVMPLSYFILPTQNTVHISLLTSQHPSSPSILSYLLYLFLYLTSPLRQCVMLFVSSGFPISLLTISFFFLNLPIT